MQLNSTKLILAVLAPPLAAGAGWLTAAVAKYGIHLDKTGVAAAMAAGVAGAIALALKLIHDVERRAPAALVADVKTVETAAAGEDPKLGAELGWPQEPPAQAA